MPGISYTFMEKMLSQNSINNIWTDYVNNVKHAEKWTKINQTEFKGLFKATFKWMKRNVFYIYVHGAIVTTGSMSFIMLLMYQPNAT